MVNAFDFMYLTRRTRLFRDNSTPQPVILFTLRSLAGLCAWETRWNHTDWNAFDDENEAVLRALTSQDAMRTWSKATWVHYREAGLQEVAARRQVAAFSESATIRENEEYTTYYRIDTGKGWCGVPNACRIFILVRNSGSDNSQLRRCSWYKRWGVSVPSRIFFLREIWSY
jgi:hypothetical protein